MTGPAGVPAPRRPLAVVPAFQEELVVGQVVAEIRSCVPGLDILVVDDGSRDRTRARAEEEGAQVVSLPFNLGVGGAMRVGFLYAVRHGYDAVIQVDADGQHDPSCIPDLVEALERADVVVGSRFAGSDRGATVPSRRWVMRLLARSVSMLCRTPLTDVTSGFRAAGPRAISLMSQHYPAEYLGDTVESLVIARRAGLVLAEIPVSMRGRQGGSPSQSFVSASLYLGRALLVLLLSAVRSHPDVRPRVESSS